MKAAVLHQFGKAPHYEDFPDPVPQNDNELLILVKASAIKNLDKGRASGSHYSSLDELPTVVGMDGVGVLENGQRVYAIGLTGMVAEKALIDKKRYVPLPAGIDDVTAAALPNAVMGGAASLLFRAKMQPGETVLVNGATGVTGRLAVQVAKYYGAKRVIATGRNPESLEALKKLGADEVISLKQEDEQIVKSISEIHSNTPINVIIDYTWGHPAELILKGLLGSSLSRSMPRVRYVSVGSVAGATIPLDSGILRSSAIELLGSGFGSVSAEDMKKLLGQVVPEMMQLAADGKLVIETETFPLKDIEKAWNADIDPGKRLVIVM